LLEIVTRAAEKPAEAEQPLEVELGVVFPGARNPSSPDDLI
jgi:hypothetical protein